MRESPAYAGLDEPKPKGRDYRFTVYPGENHNPVRVVAFPGLSGGQVKASNVSIEVEAWRGGGRQFRRFALRAALRPSAERSCLRCGVLGALE